jgi:hypothetical protein
VNETPPLARLVAYLAGVALLAFCITLLWLGMRAVMDLGGACASGGPYVPRVECPDAVVATTPLSIIGSFGAIGLMLWGGSGLGRGWVGLAFLAWPALFLSLGWNFLEFGFSPPSGGWVWSWLFCGILFIAMGAIPLVLALWAMRRGDTADGSYAGGRLTVRPRPGRPEPADGDVTTRLQRLDGLRRRGDLTEREYAAARAATSASPEIES